MTYMEIMGLCQPLFPFRSFFLSVVPLLLMAMQLRTGKGNNIFSKHKNILPKNDQ